MGRGVGDIDAEKMIMSAWRHRKGKISTNRGENMSMPSGEISITIYRYEGDDLLKSIRRVSPSIEVRKFSRRAFNELTLHRSLGDSPIDDRKI